MQRLVRAGKVSATVLRCASTAAENFKIFPNSFLHKSFGPSKTAIKLEGTFGHYRQWRGRPFTGFPILMGKQNKRKEFFTNSVRQGAREHAHLFCHQTRVEVSVCPVTRRRYLPQYGVLVWIRRERAHRPLMFLAYVLGYFSSAHVLSDTSAKLTFKYCVTPVGMFVFQLACEGLLVVRRFSTFFRGKTLMIFHHSAAILVDVIVVFWYLRGSRDIIEAFKEIDNLRKALSMIPVHLRPNRYDPVVFSWSTVGVFIAIHVFICTFVPLNAFGEIQFDMAVAYIFLGCIIYRQCLILSCLSYTSSLAVHETLEAWRFYSAVKCQSFAYLDRFCQVLSVQTQILYTVQKTHGVQVLILLIYIHYAIFNDMFYHIYFLNPAFSNLTRNISTCVFLGILIYFLDLPSKKMESTVEDILLVETRIMTKNATAKKEMLARLLKKKKNTGVLEEEKRGGRYEKLK
ncbi:hypothetical protein J6590_094713 [Homalodisca vitripennis]|nr:hypothetical protein J6590_094713 [Homalodisca vitripennis]